MFIILSVIIGIVLGIFTIKSDISFSSMLSFSDKNLFAYINGTSNNMAIFFSKLIESVISFLLIYIFCLSAISSVLCFIFIGYQTFLLVLTIYSIISIYGFAGVLNSLLLILPINILLLLVFSLAISVGIARIVEAKKFHEPLSLSFKLNKFYIKYAICFLCMLILCIIYSFVLPLLVKSFLLYLY
ncbi:MAG: hypothetical protein IJT25_01780 [Clostridia bacterium]|nr:hypothetical protein [Clostridia bacterium]